MQATQVRPAVRNSGAGTTHAVRTLIVRFLATGSFEQ